MANTLDYMIFGFAVIFGTIGIHIWSLFNRVNSLKKDLALLDDIDE